MRNENYDINSLPVIDKFKSESSVVNMNDINQVATAVKESLNSNLSEEEKAGY